MGIPVGPDTSLIIAEIIATAIDKELQCSGDLQGLRYIDDFHLYYRSRGDCERAISTLHTACRKFELDINDAKTVIEELPDVAEPHWKVMLRAYPFGSTKDIDADVLSYFNLAFQLSKEHPFDGVLKYAVNRSAPIEVRDFTLYMSLLCRCAIVEPGCLPDVLKILEAQKWQVLMNPEPLGQTVEELCRYHAPLQHGYEVAWAIWAAVRFSLKITDSTAALISAVEDDSVALVALHARELNLLNPDPDLIWRSWLTQEQLNREHWLAAYEISHKRWLHPLFDEDYVARHEFFAILRTLGVSFYGLAASNETDETTEPADDSDLF